MKTFNAKIKLDKDLNNLDIEKDNQLLLHSNTLGRNIGKIKIFKDNEDIKQLKLLLAGILKFNTLTPHHSGAIKEILNYPSDEELTQIIQTGKI